MFKSSFITYLCIPYERHNLPTISKIASPRSSLKILRNLSTFSSVRHVEAWLARSHFNRENLSEICAVFVTLSPNPHVSISCFSESELKFHAVAFFLRIRR
jgi:hypothetical protein